MVIKTAQSCIALFLCVAPSIAIAQNRKQPELFEIPEIRSSWDDLTNGIEYGLGRPFAFSDGELAESMLTESKRNQYRFRTFIHALVRSKPFQTK